MANSMSYNSTDLSTYGVTLVNLEYSFSSVPSIRSINMPQRHGGFTQGGFLEPLTMHCQVAVQGSSTADLLSKLDTINLILSPENGDKAISFDHISGRYWLGRFAGPSRSRFVGKRSIVLDWSFICDPFSYSTSTSGVAGEGVVEDGTITITGANMPGSIFALPLITIEPSSSVGGTCVDIQFSQTGYSTYRLKFDSTITIADTVVIDSGDEYAYKAPSTSMMPQMSSTYYTWPRIHPGANGTITWRGDFEADITVLFRARYRS